MQYCKPNDHNYYNISFEQFKFQKSRKIKLIFICFETSNSNYIIRELYILNEYSKLENLENKLYELSIFILGMTYVFIM